ncbi:transposase, partial [Mycoplasmoides gallisepticum]
VEFVKQFGPSSGKQLLNITDYIAKPVFTGSGWWLTHW